VPTVLVCYDISADGTRSRVAAVLQMWGDRIQRSVFLCTLDADDLGGLVTRLRGMIDHRTDAVHVVPLCGTCWDGITVLGQATVDPDVLYWAVL
jgi:CRISPR-associated protein Cas2